jgi:hypothetical protein
LFVEKKGLFPANEGRVLNNPQHWMNPGKLVFGRNLAGRNFHGSNE